MSKPIKKAWMINLGSAVLMAVLVALSLSLGVADFSWRELLSEGQGWMLLMVSRLPRTLAIMLTGASMAIAGMMIQVVLKNRFVEPSMVGATQSAALGMLLLSLFLPSLSIGMKALGASVMALLGMGVFMRLLRYLPATDHLMIPLVGIVFSGIIEAITTFIAYRTDSLQLLAVWRLGDFSRILAGRYEMLWLVGVLSVAAYVMADRLTIAGLGDDIARNLGVKLKQVLWASIGMVAMMSAVVVVTVGTIPFVGLVIPNIVSRMMGDRLRATLPALAFFGASATLFCDIIGRVIRYPFEIPVATVFGVLGAAVFLWLLWQQK